MELEDPLLVLLLNEMPNAIVLFIGQSLLDLLFLLVVLLLLIIIIIMFALLKFLNQIFMLTRQLLS
jgi:hypothetical protein